MEDLSSIDLAQELSPITWGSLYRLWRFMSVCLLFNLITVHGSAANLDCIACKVASETRQPTCDMHVSSLIGTRLLAWNAKLLESTDRVNSSHDSFKWWSFAVLYSDFDSSKEPLLLPSTWSLSGCMYSYRGVVRWVGLNRGMRNEEIGKWMCLQNYAHIIISQNNEGGHVERS